MRWRRAHASNRPVAETQDADGSDDTAKPADNGTTSASSQVEQAASVDGSANIVGSGKQFIFNVEVSDKIIERLFPALVGLLRKLPDAPTVINRVADDALISVDRDAMRLFARIADLLSRPGEFPPFLKVSELARQQTADPEFQKAFAAIAEQWAAEVPGGEESLSRFRDALSPGFFASPSAPAGDAPPGPPDSAPGGDPCLLVRLDPDYNGDERYRLSLIVYLDGRDGVRQPGDDSFLSLDEIRERLRGSLPALVKEVDRGRFALLIEFVVPRELLNTDFDQWPIPEQPNDDPARGHHYQLGGRYPVVVRDLERMAPVDKGSLWYVRWERLRAQADSAAHAVRWVSPYVPKSRSALTSSLLRPRAHGQVCLALLSPPSKGSAVAETARRRAHRRRTGSDRLRRPSGGSDEESSDKNYLSRAVESAGLRGLPRTVLDLRQEAEADETEQTEAQTRAGS